MQFAAAVTRPRELVSSFGLDLGDDFLGIFFPSCPSFQLPIFDREHSEDVYNCYVKTC
jgi:hypothetical protein